MAIHQQFERFHQNIRLTQAQREDARRKYTGVCQCLHDHYYEEEYSENTALLIGSYGKNTNIRPPRDVDVIFIVNENIPGLAEKIDQIRDKSLKRDLLLNTDILTIDELRRLCRQGEPLIKSVIRNHKIIYGKEISEII